MPKELYLTADIMYLYIYIHIHTHIYTYIYTYIEIEKILRDYTIIPTRLFTHSSGYFVTKSSDDRVSKHITGL